MLNFTKGPVLRISTRLTILLLAALSSLRGVASLFILSMTMFAATTGDGGAAPTMPEKVKPAQVRLLGAGRDDATGHYRAVVEIILAPGYKTYWRDPGDSGVPTEFEWGRSDNVKSAHARFPVPTRFFDGTGHAIGYLQTVRFPVEVVPQKEGQRVVLRLSASFGVCRELCIPEQADAEAILSDIEDIAGLWDEAIAQLPITAKLEESVEGLAVKHAHLSSSQLEVLVAGLNSDKGEIFVEAPAGWQLGQPKQTTQADAVLFSIPVEDSKPDFAPLAFTVIIKSEAKAIQVPLMLSMDRRN